MKIPPVALFGIAAVTSWMLALLLPLMSFAVPSILPLASQASLCFLAMSLLQFCRSGPLRTR